MKQFIMLVLCMLLISACDSGGGDTSNQNSNATSSGGVTTLSVETATEEDTFMDISGALTLNTGSVNAYWIQMESADYPVYVIEIEGRDGYLGRLAYSSELQAGTYQINNPLDAEYTQEGIFTAGLLYLHSPDESKQYRNSPTGTITIHFGDQRIIGVFEFTASNSSGSTVTVKGHLNAPLGDGVAE